ncbi:hypothetical protein SteCoe_5340 [Stentor coeruleus]|uniref:Uncharacterized protein n=1 Tax=Stentor coeruleus TaxID=5963 RepID=A0A1R2CSP5_9CILI|nr:hypothetical protein SteCoe_5340 [Stentor coeruleus]
MDNTEYFKRKISPLDAAAEWFIKGMNIGFIYAYAFRSEVLYESNRSLRFKQMSSYMFKNSVYTGGVLATWWFFNKSFEIFTNKDFWLNYSLSGVLTLHLWRKKLKLSPVIYKRYIIPIMIFSGVLGKIITSNN